MASSLKNLLTDFGLAELRGEVLLAAVDDLLSLTRLRELEVKLEGLAEDQRAITEGQRALAAELTTLRMGQTISELLHESEVCQN